MPEKFAGEVVDRGEDATINHVALASLEGKVRGKSKEPGRVEPASGIYDPACNPFFCFQSFTLGEGITTVLDQ